MPETFWNDFPGILTITLMFGGGILYLIVNSITKNWRKARVAEQNAVLRKAMLDRGFSADEIVRVMDSGGGTAPKTDEK